MEYLDVGGDGASTRPPLDSPPFPLAMLALALGLALLIFLSLECDWERTPSRLWSWGAPGRCADWARPRSSVCFFTLDRLWLRLLLLLLLPLPLLWLLLLLLLTLLALGLACLLPLPLPLAPPLPLLLPFRASGRAWCSSRTN